MDDESSSFRTALRGIDSLILTTSASLLISLSSSSSSSFKHSLRLDVFLLLESFLRPSVSLKPLPSPASPHTACRVVPVALSIFRSIPRFSVSVEKRTMSDLQGRKIFKVFNQDFIVDERYNVTKELGQGAYGIVW